jgi:cysteine desulfuration protein SufE
MSTIEQRESELVEKYLIIEDPQERLQILCGRKSHVAPVAETDCQDALLVRGCSSPVWLDGEVQEGVLHLRMTSPTPLVGALAGILCDLSDGVPAEEVQSFSPKWAEKLGVWRFLSETRHRGLAAVWQRIQSLAQER